MGRGIGVYDAVVVGARCTGSPTAMAFAREGYSVLLLDRVTFPSDTPSTHIVNRPRVERLDRWGPSDAVLDSGCPPIGRFSSHYGVVPLTGDAPPTDGIPMIVPRRAAFDDLLVGAAVEVGAEPRESFVVRELPTEGDRVVGIQG